MRLITGVAAALLGLVGLGWWAWSPQPGTPDAGLHRDGVAAWFQQGSASSGHTAGHTAGQMGGAASGAASAAQDSSSAHARKPASPLDTMILPTFHASSQGTLVMDQQTRQDVERIHALFPREEALARLDTLSSTLPAQAQRDLKALYQQYSQYAQAVAQTYPPGLSNGTLEEATQQLKGLHDLRQQYFGPERAEALFGEEEKTSQELLALMRKQVDPKLSLEDKAEQAKEEWKRRQALAKP
ncbi:MAG: hypothetical protein HYX44_15025 [Aquabacterium sp.]|nr:hypothetical protein [Aquabacterium sp.]